MSPRGAMRNSNLLKWAHNNNKQSNKNGSPSWIHSADALQRGHIAYLVKYLGSTEVDEPKGIEVVKEGIRKLTFNQQLRKAEGTKMQKVELTISIDGVAIQEPKTKRIMNQYPLHRISYCADDKGEKKFFSFIAKEQDSDQHICFVFVSDKLAEEITLTIGQAFDLAYRRFLDTSGKDLETHRQVVMLQQKIKRLEHEGNILRQRLTQVSKLATKRVVDDWMSRENISNLTIVETDPPSTKSNSSASLHTPPSLISTDLLNDTASNSSSFNSSSFGNGPSPPPVPPRAFEPFPTGNVSANNILRNVDNKQPAVGTKLEGLLLDDLEDDFNPRAFEASNGSNNNNQSNSVTTGLFIDPPTTTINPPAKASINPRPRPHASAGTNGINNTNNINDIFSLSQPPSSNVHKNSNNSTDLFGMEDFSSSSAPSTPGSAEIDNVLGLLDKRILEMKDGFSRGLSFGNEDFSLESLDPLRN